MAGNTTLRAEFERYKDRPFIFVNPGGNWGDGLIWWGAEHLAEDVGISWTSTDLDTFLVQETKSGHVVYIHGGGGFNRWTSGNAVRGFVKAATCHAGVVIQGPQSFENDPRFVKEVFGSMDGKVNAERIVMFARERFTHELLIDHMPGWINLGLDIDTALHINRETFLNRARVKSRRYDLFAIREDNELPKDVFFGSYDAVRLDPAIYAASFDHWLRIHAAARQIVTNRTHSSVAGAILGVATTLMAGSYHKNRSIWEFVLKDLGVKWADHGDTLPLRPRHGPDFLSMLPSFFRNSWKVQRIAKRLQGVPGA